MSENGAITWTNERRYLRDLVPWEHNPREINKREAERLGDSLVEFGQIQTIAIGPDGSIYDGHQRKLVWSILPQFGADYEVDVRVSSRALTERERQKLVVYLHKGTAGEWDWEELVNSFEVSDLLEWGFEEGELIGWDMGEEPETNDDGPLADCVPDALFPSDNEWGVPLLDIALQANFVELPWMRWGEVSRKSRMTGTYHFYTEDYKFNALWSDPLSLINSRCVSMVEPNVSTNEQMPMAVCLWGIYRKRWLARYAQNYGVKVFVDLNVTPKVADLNLLGVPRGWKAYSTRGLDKFLDLVDADYEIAEKHAGCVPRFVVYGGGKATEAHCKDCGFVWIPENMHEKDGRRGG